MHRAGLTSDCSLALGASLVRWWLQALHHGARCGKTDETLLGVDSDRVNVTRDVCPRCQACRPNRRHVILAECVVWVLEGDRAASFRCLHCLAERDAQGLRDRMSTKNLPDHPIAWISIRDHKAHSDSRHLMNRVCTFLSVHAAQNLVFSGNTNVTSSFKWQHSFQIA
jgi:hypothetical protein